MSRNTKIWFAASFVNGLSFSMILPLLAPLVRQLQLNELQGGALVSAGSLLMAISAMYISKQKIKVSMYQLLHIGFWGMAVTWGLFSWVLMYGLEATGMGSAVLIFILLLLTRSSTGIFMAMPQIGLQSYVMTKYQTEKDRAKALSNFGAFNSIGMIAGPLLTTSLLVFNLMTPLWCAVVLLFMMSLVIRLSYQNVATVQNVVNEHCGVLEQDISEDISISKQPNLSAVYGWLLLGFVLYLSIVTLNLTAGFYIQDHFQIGIQQSAIYFAQCSLFVGFTLVLTQIAIAKWLKSSVKTLLWFGLITLLLGFIISVTAHHIYIFQSSYLVYGIAVACLTPAFMTGAAQTAPKQAQVKVAGWCTATQAISFVFGPLVSTGLYQLHTQLPYIFLIVVVCVLMLYFMWGSQKQIIAK